MMIIYKAINKINGKIYVGQTVKSLEQRIAVHICTKEKSAFSSALRKYGLQSFKFSIIDNASSKEVLDAKEKYWIAQYNCRTPHGYNITSGGGGMNGWHPTDETRRKLSAARTGEKNPNWGKHHNDETIRR